MPNPETLEKASLYVLGLMSPAEREAFEAEQEADLTLQAEVQDLQVNVEALALAAAPLTAPAGCFERIQERIHGHFYNPWGRTRNLWGMLGWPLAACLALGWMLTSYHFSSSNRGQQKSPILSRDNLDRKSPTSPALEPSAVEQQQADLIEKQRVENARLQETLQKEQGNKVTLLDRLGKQEARAGQMEDRLRSLLEVRPGLGRLLVFNMHDPRAKSPVPNVLEDASLILANEANRRLSPSNLVTDNTLAGFSNGGVTPPTQAFNTDTKTDGVRSPTPATSTSSSPVSTTPTLVMTNVPLSGAVVVGYDQSALTGYLLMNSVPALSDSQSLQLWAMDGQIRQNVGLLPKVSGGTLQVNFKLDNLDFVPKRFFVTIEPLGGSAQPSGPIVLDGPGN